MRNLFLCYLFLCFVFYCNSYDIFLNIIVLSEEANSFHFVSVNAVSTQTGGGHAFCPNRTLMLIGLS